MIKKALKLSLTAILTITLIFTFTLTSLAAKQKFDNGFGTVDSGIVGANGNIWSNTPTVEPQNLDFSQGFKYWGTTAGPSPTTVSELVDIDGKKALHLKPKKQYDGIMSTPFTLPDSNVGSKISVLFDWKGEGEFSVQINQVNLGWIATYRNDKIISEDENGWNTSYSTPTGAIMEEKEPDTPTTFTIAIQCSDTDEYIGDSDIYVTNLRLVTVSANGQEVREYKTGNLIEFKQPASSDGNTDDDSDNNDGGNEDGIGDSLDDLFGDDDSSTDTGSSADADSDSDSNSSSNTDDYTLTIILIVAGAVVLIAVVVVVILIVVKKKKKA